MATEDGEKQPPKAVFERLGTLRKDHIQPLGNHDFSGWYKSGRHKARPWFLYDDYDQLTDELDRVLYATVNYQDIRLIDEQEFGWKDGGRSWADDENPMPDYEDLSAIAPFADIDLEDQYKERPLSDDLQSSVEEAIGEYVDRFGDLVGSTDPVFVLDSVGGAYVFISPAVTLPIAQEYGREDAGRVFDELTDRVDDALSRIRSEVNEAVPEVEGIFEPDELNNKNRLYKAPLSLHSSIDGVVHPMDTADPSYDFVAVDDVDDNLVDETEEWAEAFTDTAHSNYCEQLVCSLWDEYDGEWTDRLDQWLEDKLEEEKRRQERREAAKERREGREVDPSEVDQTDNMDTIIDAIEQIDVRDVARTVAAEYDTDPARDPPRFEPAYRASKSGTSCFVDRDKYVDLEEGQSGGGAAKLAARNAGIIRHSSEDLTNQKFWDAVDELRRLGYDIPRWREGYDAEGKSRALTAEEDDETTHYDGVDDEDFEVPELKNFVMVKAPREGGSYAIMNRFLETGDSMTVLAPKHRILGYHLETVDDLIGEDRTAVHIKGNAQVCDGGSNCHKVPSDQDDFHEAIRQVREAAYAQRSIDESDCPEDLCKSWFLKNVAEYSDVLLTVPELIDKVDYDWEGERSNLLIDEEQTLDSFRPGSVNLIEITMSAEPDGTVMPAISDAPILKEEYAIQQVKKAIKEDQEERKEQAEKEGRGWKETAVEKDLLEAIEKFDEMKQALGVTDAIERQLETEEAVTLNKTASALRSALADIEFPNPTTDARKLYEKIEEYTAPLNWDEDSDPKAVFEALFWPYRKNPWLVREKRGNRTISLIGGRDIVFNREILDQFSQIGVIAGPEGSRFLNDIDRDHEVIVLDEFKYDDDFIVVPVGAEEDGELESKNAQRRRVERICRELSRRRVPHIAVAGTKDQASQLHRSMKRGDADIIADPESPAMVMHNRWRIGGTAVLYENSIPTRGIDVPYFDLTAVTSSGFMTPYWEAVADAHQGIDEDRHQEAIDVRNEKKARELTNAALRMSPTYDTDDQYGTKFIFVSEDDSRRLLYLQDRMTQRVEDVDSAVTLAENLVARGDVELGQNDFYHGIGGGEKDYAAVAAEEQIQPIEQRRPGYRLDEVEEWVGKGWLMDREKVIEVYDFIDGYPGKPRTTEVKKKVPSSDDGRINNIMEVLRRKGVLSRMKVSDGTPGRPPIEWEIDIPISR